MRKNPIITITKSGTQAKMVNHAPILLDVDWDQFSMSNQTNKVFNEVLKLEK